MFNPKTDGIGAYFYLLIENFGSNFDPQVFIPLGGSVKYALDPVPLYVFPAPLSFHPPTYKLCDAPG